ncbi:TetR/AcrR family transcriptional regulator [bacterium]|nr:TetR/AcrR family transcriptional regulator [bacterium]MBU1936369.1 TetR/AcrR family transcriptional regulator [bacterium]
MCPNRVDKREEILKASSRLFAQFGLRKTSVDEIASRARVAKATIYKYFHSKEDIFIAVVNQEAAALTEAMQLATEKVTTAREKIRAYLATKTREIRMHTNLYRATRDSIDEYWPQMESIRESLLKTETELIGKILKDGIDRGELALHNSDILASVIATTSKGMEIPWLLDNLSGELDKFIDTLLEALFRGIEKESSE